MLGKVKSAYEILRETWLQSRVPANLRIFDQLLQLAKRPADRAGFHRYLEDYPALAQIAVGKDWYHDSASGEMRLDFSSRIFAGGCLRLKLAENQQAVIVYLPGNISAVENVFLPGDHVHNMTAVAGKLGMGLAGWDWPLQGARRDHGLYEGLKSIYSAEREYSRILPVLGTCLWREMVAELQFALAQIRRHIGQDRKIHIVGWSMGGCFAYLAPLLGTDIATTIAIGSCASVKDLLAEGKARVHGYFFYPLNGMAYFDLEDVVAETLAKKQSVRIIYGEHDAGCLEKTSGALVHAADEKKQDLQVTVLPHHGHTFSPIVKQRIVEYLSA
ncbi:MAG: hypothetical protein ABI905_12265 [Betaproteobacteria bacterium]